jgi:galactokinase
MGMRRSASIPARINIIGEHTDYLDGLALPFTCDARLVLRATASESTSGDPTIVALWEEANGWPATLEVESTIPIGAGMSSSAALCLAVVLCAQGEMKPMRACLEAQRIEHKILNTPCGLLDQMAMMFSEKDCACLIDFSSPSVKTVELPKDWLFKLIDSGVRRELSATSFGSSRSDAELQKHAHDENQRVLEALHAKPPQLGRLLNASHQGLVALGVSHPKVDAHVERLQSTPGVLGARMMGGGFGGMILVLVEGAHVLPETAIVRSSEGGFLEELLE